MGEPLVSIIVPLYNGEQTIERCLTSIRNQTYKNIEVLVVNDGSKDHSMKVLKKFRDSDPRFHILNKGNSGVSDSRNLGIKNARGKYLQFVDSDDWITKDATQTFVSTAETYNCDMVITDYHRVVNHKIYIKGHIPEEGLVSRRQFAEFMMKAPANFYYGVMWNKFFRTDIIKSHKLKCNRDLNWCEDFLFNLEYLQYVKDVYVIKTPVYYYVKTKGSLVATQVNLRQTIRTKGILFDYYKDLYKSMDIYDENKLRIQMFYIAVARDTGKRKKTPPSPETTEKTKKFSSKKSILHEDEAESLLAVTKAEKRRQEKKAEKKTSEIKAEKKLLEKKAEKKISEKRMEKKLSEESTEKELSEKKAEIKSSEKETGKKSSEKKAEKKTLEKKAEKKSSEKKTEKKLPEKKTEKKSLEKKAEKKFSEKKVEKKFSEKKSDKRQEKNILESPVL
ncbi:glycosyltransferase family 2 protein [Anaerocolumna chitinilytica]|uniref:Glycosyltransferase 2-like domain-containing protein n=1 Tax=Anaerocolumna chitinilytica TaxID=1727145 RepID=A0A7I8DG15_9FIRM|nr:glycosyltransferase family A protein [Anaerocolumna chitinilytica]BCJ97409.1 hypothetical protein bsdcttw_04500 [Anaerocolumna chitinilytica]